MAPRTVQYQNSSMVLVLLLWFPIALQDDP
jgi:hypothetical protein